MERKSVCPTAPAIKKAAPAFTNRLLIAETARDDQGEGQGWKMVTKNLLRFLLFCFSVEYR